MCIIPVEVRLPRLLENTLQDRHFSRIWICKVITINHSHATVDNGLFDWFKSVLTADNKLTKGEDKVCLQCNRAFVLGVVEVNVKRIDILRGSRRNLDNLTVKAIDKRIIFGFGVADDNIVCCGNALFPILVTKL